MSDDVDDLRSKLRALPRNGAPSERNGAPIEQGGERDHEDASSSEPAPNPAASPNPALDLSGVFRQWADEGPLVHEPTGLEELDAATGGGPVYGSRWYVLGAPDAGKTALLVEFAHKCAERGVAVGLLAADEEPSDIGARFAQRVGFARAACEVREAGALAKMNELLGALPVRLYDVTWSIEQAAADLAAFARARGVRAVLCIDSVQTVTCDVVRLSDRELTEVRTVGLNVQAIRRVATAYKMITITTSEMSRLAYTTIAKNESEQSDTMATAKWSGAIEYSARVMLSLRNVKGEESVIALEIPKNKHGTKRLARDGKAIYLEIDRARQSIAEADYTPPPPSNGAAEREAAREAAATRQTFADAAIVAAILARNGGATARELRGFARAAAGSMSSDRVDAALAQLAAAVVRHRGQNNAQRHYLDGSKLTDELVGAIASDDRTTVIVARPPAPSAPEVEAKPSREDAPKPTDDELEAEQDAKVEEAARELVDALSAATATGIELRSRGDLFGLLRGHSVRNDVKGRAVTRLITTGRIRGGHGKPFTVRRADEQPGLFGPEAAPSEAT